jgi:hypothetical protein
VIDRIINDISENLLELVIYAVGIGITVKGLAFLCRYFWNIEIDHRELVVLSAGTAALVAVSLIGKGPHVAVSVSAVIIGGFFLTALIRKCIDRDK